MHVYKDVWDPYLGDGFTRNHKQSNLHEKYAVVFLSVDVKSKRKVGHLLREVFKECCLFILHGGTISLWQSTPAYLSYGLFRSCFVVKPSSR